MAKRTWTHESIIAEIRRHHAEEPDLTMLSMRQRDPRLVASAVAHFGGWRQAVEAAGFSYEAFRRQGIARRSQTVTKWTRESVIRELERQWQLGEDLRPSATKLRLPGLYSAARKLFGSWPAVLEAAGIATQSARDARRAQRGWKRIWLERLKRQAAGLQDAGTAHTHDYQRAFETPDAIADEHWLKRLQP